MCIHLFTARKFSSSIPTYGALVNGGGGPRLNALQYTQPARVAKIPHTLGLVKIKAPSAGICVDNASGFWY